MDIAAIDSPTTCSHSTSIGYRGLSEKHFGDRKLLPVHGNRKCYYSTSADLSDGFKAVSKRMSYLRSATMAINGDRQHFLPNRKWKYGGYAVIGLVQ